MLGCEEDPKLRSWSVKKGFKKKEITGRCKRWEATQVLALLFFGLMTLNKLLNL